MSVFGGLLEEHPNLERLIDAFSGTSDETVEPLRILTSLFAACAIGWLIGQVYKRTFTGRRFSPTLPDTHMLLCLGGAMIWMVVGDNIVRAFGLAGTIGLIRYRTVVRDPKDTTILLFSMILGMACGLGQIKIAVLGAIVVLLVLIALHHSHQGAQAKRIRKSADLLDLISSDDTPKKAKKPPEDK